MSGQNRPKDWKEFDDFAAGIATNRVATTDVLRGEELGIILNSGRRITLAFPAGDLVKWQDGKKSGTDWCEVLEVARDVFFINMTFSGRPSEDEVIIANLLTKHNVNFAYEKPLIANNKQYSPDFTITTPDNKVWYWEHLGMLHKEDYRKNWAEKEAWYQKYFPNQLLTTKESATLSQRTEALILQYFIQDQPEPATSSLLNR